MLLLFLLCLYKLKTNTDKMSCHGIVKAYSAEPHSSLQYNPLALLLQLISRTSSKKDYNFHHTRAGPQDIEIGNNET